MHLLLGLIRTKRNVRLNSARPRIECSGRTQRKRPAPDVSDERKGPRVGSPDKAIEGFLRAAGLKSVDEAEIISDEKKGDFYVARIERQGRATSDIIAELIPDVIRRFPWAKSQRWGAGRLRWVRPLHSILCLLGGSVVPFDVDGIASGNETRGHRFMSSGAITVKDFADYEKKLRDAHVILEAQERQNIILEGARAAACASKIPCRLELKPCLLQPIADEPCQVLRPASLHPGGNFFAK